MTIPTVLGCCSNTWMLDWWLFFSWKWKDEMQNRWPDNKQWCPTVLLSASARQTYNSPTSVAELYTLFHLGARYMCVWVGVRRCVWDKLMLLTNCFGLEVCVKLPTMLYMTNHVLRFQDEAVAICASNGRIFFQIIMLFRHGTSIHLASAGFLTLFPAVFYCFVMITSL